MMQDFDPKRHIPVTSAELPTEEAAEMHDRPDIPPPSPWARTAVVKRRHGVNAGQRAVVHRVDFVTRQLRLWYPDRKDLPQKEQFDSRTGWQSFDDWEPEIMFSPEELERQKAKELFAQELEAFDDEGLALVMVFCDDPDPVKALGKLRALKRSNIVRTKDEPTISEATIGNTVLSGEKLMAAAGASALGGVNPPDEPAKKKGGK